MAVREINGRWACSECGRTWSAMLGDNEAPKTCECSGTNLKEKLMAEQCWITVGFRQDSTCSACGKVGKHREIRFNGGGMPTPCVWVHVCEECWKDETKWETAPLAFPPEKSHQVRLLFG